MIDFDRSFVFLSHIRMCRVWRHRFWLALHGVVLQQLQDFLSQGSDGGDPISSINLTFLI